VARGVQSHVGGRVRAALNPTPAPDSHHSAPICLNTFCFGVVKTPLVGGLVSQPRAPDMKAAYANASGRTPPDFVAVGAGGIGGLYLTPGLYSWTTSVVIGTNLSTADFGHAQGPGYATTGGGVLPNHP